LYPCIWLTSLNPSLIKEQIVLKMQYFKLLDSSMTILSKTFLDTGCRILFRILLVLFIMAFVLIKLQNVSFAQSQTDQWSNFVDLSNTPTASTYPYLIADKSGNVHVFWSEDVGGVTKNPILDADGTPMIDPMGRQINYLTNSGNTIFYAHWDGNNWSEPVDVQFSNTGLLQYPQAVVDNEGVLHLVWVAGEGLAAKVYYSKVFVSQADSANDWSQPVALVQPTLFAFYPMAIAADQSGGLHLLYTQLGDGPGVYVINSFDGGNTWSQPIPISTTFDPTGRTDGASTLQLTVDKKDRIYASWTRYDVTGNGREIYFAQSLDQGRTWSAPFQVAKWQPGWYEVDWLSVGVIGDEIHLTWEGSSRTANINERISHDGGQTWGSPSQIFPNLVGENGFSKMVVDNADQLHLLTVNRADPDSITNGLWYSTWSKNHWSDPILVGTQFGNLYNLVKRLKPSELEELLHGTLTGNGIRYPQAVVVNGNQLFAVVANEYDGEIWSSHTNLAAPFISPAPYPTPKPTSTPTPTSEPQSAYATTVPMQLPKIDLTNTSQPNPGESVFLGVIPAFLLVSILFLYAISHKTRI
jgi:hypothetical protein